MKLTWQITKKRGNWRPTLNYECLKDSWEVDLAVPGGTTAIKLISAVNYSHNCMPGDDERAEPPTVGTAQLSLPRSGDSKFSTPAQIRLPWRPGAHPAYPEVAEAMNALMAEWERRVLAALDSGALDESGEAEYSPNYKRAIAPYLAARRMLT